MAKSLGSLVLSVGVDNKRLRSGFDKSRGIVAAQTKAIKAAALGAAKALGGIGAGLSAGLITQRVLQDTREFGAAISELSAITGATGKDLDFLRDKSREFGAASTLSATESVEAFKLIASAKPDLLQNAEALTAVTKETIALAEASGTQLPDAARTVGVSLNQFGASAAEAARFVNVLAAGAKFGASEIEDTAEAIRKSGVQARQSGASFEDLNALIQILAENGIKGSEAGTALRNIFTDLATKAEDQFNPAVVGVSQALKNLGQNLTSNQETVKLFSRENVAAANVLKQSGDKFDELKAKITGTTTAYDQQAARIDNLDGDFKKLQASTEALSLSLGDELEPAFRASVQSTTELVSQTASMITTFNDLSDQFDASKDAIDSMTRTDLVDWGETVGRRIAFVADVVKNMVSVFSIAATGIASFVNLTTNNVNVLAKRFGNLIGVVSDDSLSSAIQELGSDAGESLDTLKRKFDELINGPTFRGAFEDNLRQTFEGATKAAEETGKNIADALSRGVSGSSGGESKEDTGLRDRQASVILGLQRQLALQGELTEVARARFEIERGAFREFTEGGQSIILGLSQQLDINRELAEAEANAAALREEREQQQVGVLENLQRQIDFFGDLTREEEALLETTKGIYKEFDEGTKKVILAKSAQLSILEETARAEKAAADAAKEAAEEAQATAKSLGLTFSSAFEDAVVEGKKLGEVLKSLEQDIIRIISRKLVTEPLANAIGGLFGGGLSGGSGGGGGFFQKLLGLNQGGQFAIPGGGGIDNQLVAFRGTPGEVVTVTPRGDEPPGGGGPTIVMHINGVTDADSFNRSAGQIQSGLQNALALSSKRNL